VAHEAKLCLLAGALTQEPGIRIGRAGMSIVAAPLAVEVTLAVAAGRRRFVRSVFRAEALQRSPGLDQRAVDREVIGREQAPVEVSI